MAGLFIYIEFDSVCAQIRRPGSFAEALTTPTFDAASGKKERDRSDHEQQRATATRPVPECSAQGTRPGIDLSRQRHQTAGPDRVIRPVRRTSAQHRHANGLQACDFDRRAGAPRQSDSGGQPPERIAVERRTAAPARAIVVGVAIGRRVGFRSSMSRWRNWRNLRNPQGRSSWIACSRAGTGRTPRYFLGRGKVDEVRSLAERSRADTVMFDVALSPVQQRNLERELNVAVLDRTTLDPRHLWSAREEPRGQAAGRNWRNSSICRHASYAGGPTWSGSAAASARPAVRARSRSNSTGARSPTGQAAARTPGTLHKQRRTQRRARGPARCLQRFAGRLHERRQVDALQRADACGCLRCRPVVRHARHDVTPLLRGRARRIVLSDTVGFIRGLPHTLVEAFKSTLEESIEADLLMHVVDASSPTRDAQIEEVDKVLGGNRCR